MKIAILGGSFDPVHEGHLQMARTALEQLGADAVWFMPAADTPLKDRQLTPAKDRLAMLEAAVENEPRFQVCTLEMERGGRSYTIDTARALKEQYPDTEFVWLIGNDQLKQFSKWKDVDELVQLMPFAAFSRDGKLSKTRYPVRPLQMEPVPVSSTQVRRGECLNYVPRPVLDYIYKNRLYIKDFLPSRMAVHRYLHSLSVASLCEEIALANGLDGDLAFVIGLFHDIAKQLVYRQQRAWMEKERPDCLAEPVPVWHGYVGAAVAREVFYLDDPVITNAIASHVHGSSTEPYAMIVYCADKLDPLRGYDSRPLIQACMQDIRAGFDLVYVQNQEYLRLKDKGPVPMERENINGQSAGDRPEGGQ